MSPDEERTLELLRMSLSAAVPLWIVEMETLPWSEVEKIAKESSQVIAEHGDEILFKSAKKGNTAKYFNSLARGIAALSFAPGGVKIFGLHWESKLKGPEMGDVRSPEDRVKIALTERGVKLHLAMRTIFEEYAIYTGKGGGEDQFKTTEQALNTLARRWDELWRREGGMERNTVNVEILGELTDRPRSVKDTVRRLVRKVGLSAGDVFREIKVLLEAGLITEDLRESFVVT